ncbi:MAG TPA: deoxyribose-phosphate aldolase [Acidimicrobiales bacterium]|nr:deoxyribose-phosphate aldolase [Acidimicrobiales bacterium]
MERAELARMIDHTLLDPAATPGQVALLCGEASVLGVGAVCVAPNRLPLPQGGLPDTTAVCTVIGFPSGAHRPEAKAAEAVQAVADGATELDMVIDLGWAMAGLWDRVEADIAAVRAAAPDSLLKVIIESAALADDRAIVAACHAAEAAGADFVKTSTGFHPAGGASLGAVALMAETVGGRLGVKASGGIRDAATALAMVDAGATRLGCSASRAILEQL